MRRAADSATTSDIVVFRVAAVASAEGLLRGELFQQHREDCRQAFADFSQRDPVPPRARRERDRPREIVRSARGASR